MATKPTTTDWLPGVDLTNLGWWDVAQMVQQKYGPNAVAEMANSGFFDAFPSFSSGDAQKLGGYVAARQAEQDSDFGEDFFSNPLNAALATAGFGVGGTSGASLATGGGVTPQTLALDAAGLGAGAGLAGFMGAPAVAPAASAPSAATGGTVPGVGLNPAASGVGLNPASAGVGFQATPGAVSAFEAGINIPGLAGAGAIGGGSALAGASGTGVAPAAATGGAALAAPAATGISGLLSSPTALGIGAGALLGGLGGSSEAGTIQTEEGIPDWLMPYVKPQLDKYATDLQNYQIDPYGVMPSAMKEFQNTISGQYLDPSTNKYLEDYFRLGAERIKGSLSPSFGHMQAFGAHSGYNEALSRGLGDFSTGLYGGAYSKERDRQSQMTAAAPAFIGQSSQAAFQPYSQYLQTVGSLGKKKDQPFYENQFGNILGGAMLGGSLGKIWS